MGTKRHGHISQNHGGKILTRNMTLMSFKNARIAIKAAMTFRNATIQLNIPRKTKISKLKVDD